VLEPHFGAADRARLDPADPLTLLDTSPFAALRLRTHPAFVAAYLRLVDSIATHGIRIALASALSNGPVSLSA
jgi:hypothetical protein